MIKLNKLLIDNEDYTDYAVWTLQGQETLDESLDLNYIELKGIDLDVPFQPFLNVTMEIQDSSGKHTIKRLVESDTVTEVISNKSYNHNLLCIEETKWLERLFVEKTVRQPLIHDYSEINPYVFVEFARKANDDKYKRVDTDKADMWDLLNSTVITGTTLTLSNPIELMWQIYRKFNIEYPSISLEEINAKLIISRDGIIKAEQTAVWDSVGTLRPDWTFNFTPDEEGSYDFNITLTGEIYDGGDYILITDKANFSISSIITDKKKEDYTIKDVINQLLETCITLREGETKWFELARTADYLGASSDYKKQIDIILNTTSPEFTFSKMSLFEALKTIGDFAHFIPRLQNRKIYFDLLGQMEYADTESLGEYYSNVSSQASNDFCNALDSQVNNLTNMDDVGQGSVSTPSTNGYRTLRTEMGNVQITDTNIIIPTEDNIEDVVKLEIGYLNDSENTYVGDITPFVFEEDEYNTLSSYNTAFPLSKMFAIKYKQGAKNITELSFKRENAVSGSFEDFAIKNIIYKKLGRDINWWNSFWSADDVAKLQYRLTYIPSTNTKVTQFKENPDEMSSKPLYIAYNQSASKVSSNAYGENLKGTIAKLGNVVKTKMYILPTFDLIPKCGTLFDKDYYISVVKYEVYPNFIKCEVGLSKNYNNKSAYVEINSQLEFFEYNRNITIDRYVVYEEFCEIMDEITKVEDNRDTLITEAGLDKFKDNFVYSENSSNPLSIVKAQGYSDRSGALTEVVLPVISLGIGNSLLFAYHYEDTISAGTRAFNSSLGRYQNYVKYTDIYGEVDKLKLTYGLDTQTPSSYAEAVSEGDSLPLTTNLGETTDYFATGDDKIVLRKGVGENPHITYQIHFVTRNKDYVIGSGLTRKNVFTNSEPKMFKLYALKEKINKFETKIDLTNAVEVGTLEEGGYNTYMKYVAFEEMIAPEGDYVAWAIVQTYNNSNDLIIGKNIDFKGGDTLTMPIFVFKRRV